MIFFFLKQEKDSKFPREVAWEWAEDKEGSCILMDPLTLTLALQRVRYQIFRLCGTLHPLTQVLDSATVVQRWSSTRYVDVAGCP